jgi:hypothetical protein
MHNGSNPFSSGGGAGATPMSNGALSTSAPDTLAGGAGGGADVMGAAGAGDTMMDLAPLAMMASRGGEVPIMASPREIVVPPRVARGSPSMLRTFVTKSKGGRV